MAKTTRGKTNVNRKRSSRQHQPGFFQNRWKLILGLVVVGVVIYLAIPGSVQPLAPEESPRMLEKFPHDTTAFTQGLLFEEGSLYESTGRYGASSLRRVDLKTGAVELRHELDSTYFAEGLAALNGKLYQLTWKERVGFVYDIETLAPLHTFAIPTREGWGLAEDGEHLILSDGSEYLRFLDPESMSVLREIRVHDGGKPVTKLNELEYIDGLIYANVWQNSRVAIIDPEDGRVINWLNFNWLNVMHSPLDGADVLNGIAYDPAQKRLYITGKLWPFVYAFKLPNPLK